MITKAEILQLPKGAYTNEKGELVVDNKFKIYVPIFCRAGESKDNPLGLSTMYATLCYNPGAENGYRVGDVVYISFENNQVGEPVIIGKLFLNTTQESTNTTYLIGDELNISNNAKLPISTLIGNRSGSDIDGLFRRVDDAENRIDSFSQDNYSRDEIDALLEDKASVEDLGELDNSLEDEITRATEKENELENTKQDKLNNHLYIISGGFSDSQYMDAGNYRGRFYGVLVSDDEYENGSKDLGTWYSTYGRLYCSCEVRIITNNNTILMGGNRIRIEEDGLHISYSYYDSSTNKFKEDQSLTLTFGSVQIQKIY